MKRTISLLGVAALIVTMAMQVHLPGQVTSSVVTRAQAVTSLLLSRAPKLPTFDAQKKFADLVPGKWYEAYMRAAEQYGIIEADANNKLFPDQPINRAEFLKMIARTFGLQENLPHIYADVPPHAWYARFAGIAQEFQLFPDDRNTLALHPQKLLTDKEASKALESMLRALGKLPADRLTDEARKEQQLSSDQAAGKLQLYLVISTQRLRVRLMKHAEQESSEALAPMDPKEQKTLADLRADLMLLVNRARTASGLKPVKYNVRLERSAQAYAEDMATRGYFSHVSPEGETLKDRIQRGGYRDRNFQQDCFCVKGYALAENLARGQRTPEEAIRAWMKSPSHRAAILSGEYKEIGFGISAGYWVQHFGNVVLPGDVFVKTSMGEVVHGATH